MLQTSRDANLVFGYGRNARNVTKINNKLGSQQDHHNLVQSSSYLATFLQGRRFCMGPPSSEIYLHVGECSEVWLQGYFQGMELRLSNTTNPPSVAYSTESQKTTKTHYVLQNSNKQFQHSFILFHPSSFTLPPSPS